LIDNHAKGQWLDEGAAILRRLFGLSQRYKFSGASRGDFAAKNARSELAREMYAPFGEIPQDILEGARKSKFAPALSTGPASTFNEDDQDEGEDFISMDTAPAAPLPRTEPEE